MKRNLNIGNKINDWTVESKPFIVNGKRKYRLICKCGKINEFSESYINKSIFSKSCRACGQIRRRKNSRQYNIGDVIMNFKILEIYSGKIIKFLVLCNNCGNEKEVTHATLNKKSNGVGSGYCDKCFDIKYKSKKKYKMVSDNISLSMFNKLSRQANLRGIEFDITPEYLESIYNGKCYFTNKKINIGTYSTVNGKKDLGDASLDRLDSTLGYVIDNVVWVYKPINVMKHTLESENFIELCKLVCKKWSNE